MERNILTANQMPDTSQGAKGAELLPLKTGRDSPTPAMRTA
ncbi:hypothetical protein AB0O52_05120 [Arthrobacter sp. NPDC080073]